MAPGLIASFLFATIPESKSCMVWCALLSLLGCLLSGVTSLQAQHLNTDSLRQMLPKQNGIDKINTLNALAAQTDLPVDSSLNYAIQALNLAREINDNTSIINSEYELGELYAHKKADTAALQHLRHAFELAQEEDNSFLITSGYLRFARYYLIANNPRKSIEYSNHALAMAEKNTLKKQLAEAYFRLGAAYKALGVYQNSVSHFLKALRIQEELNDRREIAKIYSSIGTVYQRTRDFDDALDYFNRSMKISESYHDDRGVLNNILNIGVIHQKKKNYEDALLHYNRALPLARTLNDASGEAILTGNIGSTLIDSGKPEEGLEYLNKALALKEKIKNPASILHTLNDIADVKIRLGDGKGAKGTAERVVNMATQYEVSDQLRYGYLNLSKSYRLLKDYEKAYNALRKYNSINDSLFSIQKAQQINELQVQYDTEKKDMAINALQQEKQIANAQRKIYFLAGAIILLVLAGLYINQRQKTKRNQQLLEKEREVDRLKSSFFANISHEFRTPLSLILGPIETLQSKINDPDKQFQLGLMKKNASRLMRLINQILDLSKLQAGYLELKATELNVVDLIRGVSATFQSLIDSKGIQFKFESKAEEIMVYCDQERIETICINLISNAFKFSDTGGEIMVRMNKIDPVNSKHAAGEMELHVIDNGVGISAEHLSHIFDRFYQAGSASEKQYGGTGIGLALTKELVELHGGTISVTSEPGTGTTVTVRIPLGKDHLREDQIIHDSEPGIPRLSYPDLHSIEILPEDSDATEKNDTEKPLVLLIDDNEDVRNYIKSILHTQYTLLEAVNGEEGIRQAKSFIPDLIISDVMMPEMNGYEACKRLKKDEKTSHIPVILLTAKASIDSRIQGLETEADLYLNKPFVPKELELCINNLIQSRKKLRERYNRQMVLKPTEIAINSTDELFLQKLMKIVEANYADENFSVEQLSMEIGMSRSQLHRKLHALTNESTSQFIRSFRLQRAMELLKKNHASVSEIAFMVGFASHQYFNKCFSEQYGRTPSSVIEESVTAEHKGE
jgi:signal transduction histidine kinase/DNA-binding response OmpR family regulator/tetratricopeptide (TPR) repeat protein